MNNSGKSDAHAAQACRSDSVVELFPVHLKTILNLLSVQTAVFPYSGLQTKYYEFLNGGESV